VTPIPVTLTKVEDDRIYKICLTVTFENMDSESDCAIYPSMIRKPTTTMAPTTTEMPEETGLRAGDIAAIILAVLLIILIVLIVLFGVYLWRTNRLRDVMPRKSYRQQASHDGSDGRSSSQSPSSDSKHDDPLDFRPAEKSPMMGHGGRTYEEHDL